MVKDLRANKAKDVECTVVKNEETAFRTFHLVLEGDFPPADPGQFAMVIVTSLYDPFLRRPLAILGQKDRTLEMLYRIRGTGTMLLSQKRPGESIRILTPLGKGFRKPESENIIFVVGGMGLPPILSLAEKAKAGCFIYGAKKGRDMAMLDRINTIPKIKTVIVTEDGSSGEQGLATDVLKRVSECISGDTAIYACGPEEMLYETRAIAETIGARCEVSLEERMSCGFGACFGCVVKTIHGNVRVCREGPVFNAFDIIWS
jgi:dihydroorotate dehydrogenase electron transfer subunit